MPELYRLVAEVWAASGGGALSPARGSQRAGSGMVIAPSLVLTALHVVLDVEQCETVPDDARCHVRLVGDVLRFNGDQVYDFRVPQMLDEMEASRGALAALKYPGRLIWPPPGSAVGEVDLALVQLDLPPTGSVAAEVPAVAVRSLEANRAVDCVGIGFPAFKAVEDGDRRVRMAHSLRGTIFPAALGAARGFGPTQPREVQVNNDTPHDARGWAGVSGAALFDEHDALIGIVHDTDLRVHGARTLRVLPIAPLLGTRDLGTVSGLTVDAARGEPAFRPDAHIVELDRSVEDMMFRDQLETETAGTADGLDGTATGRNQPAAGTARVVVVVGYAEDEIDLCVGRFANILRERVPDAGNPYADLITVGVRSARLSAEMRQRVLFKEWAQQVSRGGALRSLDACRAAVLQALGEPDRPRLVTLQHLLPQWQDSCEEVLDAVFELIAAAPVMPPAVLFLCVQVGTKTVEELAVRRNDFAGKELALRAYLERSVDRWPSLAWGVDLPSLQDCQMIDVHEWLNVLAERQGVRATAASLIDVEDQIQRYGEVPLGFVRARVVQDLEYEKV